MTTLIRHTLACTALAFGILLAPPLTWAQRDMWQAESKTAQSITGDVALTETKISISYSSFPIGEIRSLSPAEAGSVFDVDTNKSGGGTLFRVNIPGDKKFLHGNTLCGKTDVQWMAAYITHDTLNLAFFSGSKPPTFTPESISNSTDLCGTFSYSR